jgi:lysophospholipase L1-like esterase
MARIQRRGAKAKALAFLFALVVLGIGLVLVEIGLRLFTGAPVGQFSAWFPGSKGLYPENSVIEMTWGRIPYTVRVNSLGFRGPEPQGGDDTPLIAAIGDSLTDGFFVDDPDTYPTLLQHALKDSHGRDAQVINAARAGGSIDKQFAILREKVLPLRPRIVVLLFCMNDLTDLRGRTRDELLDFEITPRFKPHRELARWFLTRTATGEVLYDRYLRATLEQYRLAREQLARKENRYDIPGAMDIPANLRHYEERSRHAEAILAKQPLSPEAEELLANYLFVLDRFRAACDENGVALLFVFAPCYAQVYDPAWSLETRDRLKQHCAASAVPFHDLTPRFREVGATRPLHLAPVDFHHSPDGNRLIAEEIASKLAKEFLGTAEVKPASGAGGVRDSNVTGADPARSRPPAAP